MELSDKETDFITYLCDFLRANGNEILVGKKKLSLTSSVLCILNKLYIDSNNTSNVIANDLQLKENLNFLLNIISNVVALKVTHCVETVQGGIDLSIFKSLLMLEVRKIPFHLLIGLNEFCSQLETLVCSCSISSLHELLSNRTNNLEWTALKRLNLAQNYLEDLEECIKLFPNLQTIDASHNRLINANGLHFLTKLCAANLGYNNFSKIPTFSKESYRCLKELSLRNNNLEDIYGLENVRYLQDLDLSYNCLSDQSVLSPIQNLPYLQALRLIGNPLTVQRFYRTLTAKNFHLNVLTGGVKLDGHKLTKAEIGKVAQVRNVNVHLAYEDNTNRIQLNSPLEDSGNHLETVTPIFYPSCSSLDEASVANESLLKDDTISITSVNSDIVGNSKRVSKSKAKRKKGKEVIIPDCASSQQNNSNYPEKNKCEAQECKATLVARRENLGSEWLISAYSSLPSDSILAVNTRSTTDGTLVQKMPDHQQTLAASCTEINSLAVDGKEEFENIKHSEDTSDKKAAKKISVASDGIEVICSDHTSQDDINDNDFNFCKSCRLVDQEDDGDDFQNSRNAYNIKYGIAEEDENPESNIFLIEKKVRDITTTIFISIGDKYLNEKDVLSADILESLELSVLESVERLEKNVIKLEFKIFKVSKRERVYCVEDEIMAEKILSLLLPHAEARNLKSIVKNALKCLKCSAQFSKNIINERFLSDTLHPLASYLLRNRNSSKPEFEDKDVCPVCESLMIVEDNECPITATLLQKVNCSPADISGYLFTTPTSASSVDSMELPPNLLLTFKHPTKIKRNDISHMDKATVCVPCQGDSVNNSDSDESSVCTALEHTSQELAENGSASIDMSYSNDNLNAIVKQLPCVTGTDDPAIAFEHEVKQMEVPENNICKDTAMFDASARMTKNGNHTDEIIYDTFTDVNHVLKLYVETQLFEDNEELEAVIEAVIVPHSTTVKNKGLLLLSTSRIHFMKLMRDISDNPEKDIVPLEAMAFNKLHTVLVFVGNQGVSFMWGTEKNRFENKTCYTCLFMDADYCCSFVTFLTDFIKLGTHSLPAINSCSEDNLMQVKQEVVVEAQNGKPLSLDINTDILAFLLVHWCQPSTSEKVHETVALVLTSTDFCVAQIVFTKQSKSAKFSQPVERYVPITRQKMVNLISVHPHFELCQVGLHFVDEDSSEELFWVITAKTRKTINLLINTIKEPWQESFGVELQLDLPADCRCIQPTTARN